jgi:hypothetical protein
VFPAYHCGTPQVSGNPTGRNVVRQRGPWHRSTTSKPRSVKTVIEELPYLSAEM